MKAILTTQCGCTREMNIPFPPQPEILVPLRRDWDNFLFDENQAPHETSFGVRRFVIHRWLGSPYNPAEYLEK